jgi:DNA phosphorothioation-dependent restriction protein DptG
MTARGVDFLEDWIDRNATQMVKDSVDGDEASLAIEMAERAIAEAAKAGLTLDDLEPEFGTPEIHIREAAESIDGSPGN